MFDLEFYKYIMKKNGYSFEGVAKALNINPSTLFRKFKRNGDFTRDEIVQHIILFHLNVEDMNRIFFSADFTDY